MIHNSEDNVLHVLDANKYAEVSADAIFSHKSTNAEVKEMRFYFIMICFHESRSQPSSRSVDLSCCIQLR